MKKQKLSSAEEESDKDWTPKTSRNSKKSAIQDSTDSDTEIDFETQSKLSEQQTRKGKRKTNNSDDESSDIGDSSKSILDKVSVRSKTMSNRKQKKASQFDTLKDARKAKLSKRKL